MLVDRKWAKGGVMSPYRKSGYESNSGVYATSEVGINSEVLHTDKSFVDLQKSCVSLDFVISDVSWLCTNRSLGYCDPVLTQMPRSFNSCYGSVQMSSEAK